MGFIRQNTVLVLDFEDTELHGLTAKASRCSFDDYIAISRALDRPTSGIDDFARDVAELQDKQVQLALYNAYRYAITVVPRPLEKPSGSGEPSPVESLQMEVLSGSQSS
jgi:hypothetical protein